MTGSFLKGHAVMPRNAASPAGYDPAIKFMHWLTLALMVAVFVLANAIDLVPRAQKDAVEQLHRSTGMTIWLLTLARLVWRQFTHLPPWPETLPVWARLATAGGEYALYGLLLLQPVLGLVHIYAHGDRLNFFLLWTVPYRIQPDRAVADLALGLHGIVANVLLALIGLHAAAGLFRHLWLRDNALRSMLPGGG